MRNSYGPRLAFSDWLHATKYRGEGEDFREAGNRIAAALADDDGHFRRFREVFLDMRFLPAGRVQAAVGSTRGITPYNCYVSGTIEDSFVDGPGSIMGRAHQAAATMRQGGGIGYDFSTLRPKGDLIKTLGSVSSGPLSFMEIFDATCRATCSAGHRRGAEMGVLRIDHPDIEAFIHAKQRLGYLEGFNISVAVTDEFMECKAAGRPFPLRFGGRVYRHVDPDALWEQVMRATWDWAEPGVLFIDTINRMNNLWYCETIAATNPCGEQPLPPFGACLLGSFNLVRYVRQELGGWCTFDWDQLRADVAPVVRAMDNVVDVARYPLPEQEHEAKSKRRMGLGITGLANAAEAFGYWYGSEQFLTFERTVLRTIRDEAYRVSVQLAREKGSFPLYDADLYPRGEFIKTLPGDVQDGIRRHGIRNSHLTSIAPTGTISMAADNVSSSIEPVFDYEVDRVMIGPEGPMTVRVTDYAYREWGVLGRRAREVTAAQHVDVLATAQALVDSAVSKTCNVSGDMPWDEFKGIYQMAYERGCKGITTFNEDGKRMGILTGKTKEERSEDAGGADQLELAIGSADEQSPSCTWDPATGRRSCE